MAKYESLRGLFTATADAIRAKTGGTDVIVAEDFPEFIEGIEPVIEPLTISENGTYTAPDGVDGYSPVTVDVKGSGEELVITDFSYFCYSDARLSILDKIDTSKGIKFDGMFAHSTKNSVDYYTTNLDTSNGEIFAEMFAYCKEYNKQPPMFDTSKGTSFRRMFYSSNKIPSIPLYDTSNGTDFNDMFSGCTALTSVPELNTSNGTEFSNMFYNCKSLVTIPKLDLVRATNVNYMLNTCSILTNLYLYNIRKTIQIGSGTSWGHLLTVDSLVHAIKELCTVTSSQTLTIGSANLEKIAGLYCRITDATHEKKTMELCESTDEGAMTLSDYASEKNWLIQ